MELLLFKAIHIIAAIVWLASMFFNGVLFYFHRKIKISQNDNASQSTLLTGIEKSIYKYFMTPAMLLTWVAGSIMLYIHGYEWFKTNMWIHHKLLVLLFLTAYHGISKGWIRKLDSAQWDLSPMKWKVAFYLPLILTVGLVTLAVFKNSYAAHFLIIPMLILILIMLLLPSSSKK